MRALDPRSASRVGFAILLSALLACTASFAGTPGEVVWTFDPVAPTQLPPLQPGAAMSFVLDDGTAEGAFGVSIPTGGAAQQFLWFNQFPLPPDPVVLQEIQVLFLPGANIAVGDAVQLVVFHDPDGDPTNGATLLTTLDSTIQALDGATFSVYTLFPSVLVPGGGDLLVGVVSRYVVTGVTGPTNPAAIDTTASQGRSWVAIWNADPPNPPLLPPDQLLDLVDVFIPGNWMIRALAAPGSSSAVIPTLGGWGLGILVLLLAAGALLVLRLRG